MGRLLDDKQNIFLDFYYDLASLDAAKTKGRPADECLLESILTSSSD